MAKFPSDEWAKAFMNSLNTSKTYAEAAKTWEGDFVFIVTPDKPGEGKEYYLYFDLWHGVCRAASMLNDPNEKKAAFIWSGTFTNYTKIMTGEIDPIKGLMQGKFKLKGNMSTIMRAVKAAQELVNCLKTVPTEYDK